VTADVERATRFYTELLGWELETWKPGERDYPMISTNGTQHGGFLPLEAVGATSSHWVGNVVVENVVEAASVSARQGGTIRGEPGGHPEVGSWASIIDPHGGAISAFTPNYDSPAPSGVFLWDELVTPDPDGAAAFYGAVFGWTAEQMDMGGAGAYTLFKKADGQSVAGMMQKPAGAPGGAAWLPYLASDDVDADVANAAELGAQTIFEPAEVESVGRFAVLVDPTGATFGLLKEA
jgi:uncharacterized protein